MTVEWAADLVLARGEDAPEHGRSRSIAAWREEHAAAGARLWSQPAGDGWHGFPLRRIEAPGWRLWLLGELYGPRARDIAADVATGRAPARDLNGHFLLVGHEEATGRWHVWTSRFGTVHVYVGPGPTLSTGFRLAARHARGALDDTGIATFLAFAFFPNDRTYLDDVKVVPPSSHVVIERDGRVRSERTWEWWHRPRPRRMRDAAAEFGDLFQRVMGEMLAGGRVALPVSGGLDSRTTVALMNGADRRGLWAYSYGYTPDSVETDIAGRIARAARLPFQRFVVGDYLFARLPRVIDSVEGFQDVTQARQAGVLDELAAHADFVIAAHWGDVWMDTMGARPGDDFMALALKKFRKPGGEWLARQWCEARGLGSLDELVRGEIERGLPRVAGIAEPDFRLKALKTEQWSHRWTLASLRMYQAAAYPRLPFYDTRVSDLFAELPSELQEGRRLQIEAIKLYSPRLALIRWQERDANLYLYRYGKLLGLPRRIARRARRLVSGRAPIYRNWEVQLLGPQGQAALADRLLGSDRRIGELLPRPRLRALLDDFRRQPDRERGYQVSMLLTVSEWLEWT